ncbi:MAG: GDP-mannose 4,6-dehydratase [Nanoarchaeota archaeon]
MRKALITGITGQDGSYLAEFLLDKGYDVHGIVRRVALEDPIQRLGRINHIRDRITLHPGTIDNYSSFSPIFERVKPEECYHLAAQSFVAESFDDSASTMRTNIEGTLNVLNAIHAHNSQCKFYFAGSSEMFGKVKETPQTENTPFHPRSPYGITKVAGFDLTRNFRESYGVFACSGILFNHESPRRGGEFVTRKITKNIARIRKGMDNVLILGNLDAKRDWGYSKDYVEAMWLMLQQDSPDDYVIATGENHSIREFLDIAFRHVGLKYYNVDLHALQSSQADETVKELRKEKEKIYVVQHPIFYRPAEVQELLGDCAKAKDKLGWTSQTSFKKLVEIMVDNDLNLER